MQTAFQSGAFQVSGFQIVAEVATETVDRPAGGWGAFTGFDKTRKDLEYEELLAEIEALEQHIAEERNVKREVVRIEAHVRAMPYLPKPVKRAVQRALTLQTYETFQYAEFVLQRLQEEQEDEEVAVLLSLALH